MGELGSGNKSSFPASRDTNSTAEVNTPAAGRTKASAEKYEDLADAIVKTQSIMPITSEAWVASSGIQIKEWGISGSGTGFLATKITVSTSGGMWITGDVRVSGFIGAPIYTNSTRPAAASWPKGTFFWNSDDNAPNYSDGTNWRDAAGNIT